MKPDGDRVLPISILALWSTKSLNVSFLTWALPQPGFETCCEGINLSALLMKTIDYYRLLSTVYCLLSTVYCLLSTVYCLLFTVYCLLSTVYCLLSTATESLSDREVASFVIRLMFIHHWNNSSFLSIQSRDCSLLLSVSCYIEKFFPSSLVAYSWNDSFLPSSLASRCKKGFSPPAQ